MRLAGVEIGRLQGGEVALQPVTLEHQAQAPHRLAGSDPQHEAALEQGVEQLARAWEQGLVEVRPRMLSRNAAL